MEPTIFGKKSVGPSVVGSNNVMKIYEVKTEYVPSFFSSKAVKSMAEEVTKPKVIGNKSAKMVYPSEFDSHPLCSIIADKWVDVKYGSLDNLLLVIFDDDIKKFSILIKEFQSRLIKSELITYHNRIKALCGDILDSISAKWMFWKIRSSVFSNIHKEFDQVRQKIEMHTNAMIYVKPQLSLIRQDCDTLLQHLEADIVIIDYLDKTTDYSDLCLSKRTNLVQTMVSCTDLRNTVDGVINQYNQMIMKSKEIDSIVNHLDLCMLQSDMSSLNETEKFEFKKVIGQITNFVF